MNNKINSKMMD